MVQQFCTECGAVIDDSMNFCDSCGAPVRKVPPPESSYSPKGPALPKSAGTSGSSTVAIPKKVIIGIVAVIIIAIIAIMFMQQGGSEGSQGSDAITPVTTPTLKSTIEAQSSGAIEQVMIEANKDYAAQGEAFTVTITGIPYADYYLWLTGTSATISQDDEKQPPMIAEGQTGIKLDNPKGPYNIGKYQFEGGYGKSIKQDVTDERTYHGTRYYCLVTLDSKGIRTVKWQTSKNTKPQKSYTVLVERRSGNQYMSDDVDVFVGEN